MKIISLLVGELGTNCYIITDENGTAAIVDPGADADAIHRVLKEENVSGIAVLLTHAHFDHIGAASALSDLGPLYCHTLDVPALQDGRLNLSAFFGHPVAPIKDAVHIEDGEKITIGGLTFTVLHTPGHTVGSCCYQCGNVLFAGDTLFCESIGRTDFPGGDLTAMHTSLSRLAALEGDVRVYPGHGATTTIAHERQYNPYLVR